MTSDNDVQNLSQIANFELDLDSASCHSLYDDSVQSQRPTTTQTRHPNNDDDTFESALQTSQPVTKQPSLLTSRISFGSTRDMQTQSLQNLNNTTGGVAMAMAVATDSEDEDYDALMPMRPPKMRAQDSTANIISQPPKKGVLKNSKAGPIHKKKHRLTKISAKYDLDGSGELDEIEQAMRDRDKDGDGQLDNAEVYRIVQDQLKNQHDVKLYRKVAAALLCLVAILALSNFGTSWATAILSRETVADGESGTIQTTKGDVMGFQDVSHEIILEPLSDIEFEERRRLVDAEMMQDFDHEDHIHRRLGKKGQRNHCSCAKVAYDNGKIAERDLLELTYKCDGVNTVSIKRKWKNRDGSHDVDVDTICGPGTTIVRKGKRKRNKNKTKVRVVDEGVTLRRKGGRGEKDGEIHFDCVNGYCFGSGKTLLQGKGHSCNLAREADGASECQEGLVCYDKDGDGYTGECVKLQRYARENQVCEVSLGVDACVANYACYSTDDYSRSTNMVGVVETGICQEVRARNNNNNGGNGNSFAVELDDNVCDASFGVNACDYGYTCLEATGRELNGSGIGYCTRLVRRQRSGGTCNLAFGNAACANGHYCLDRMLAQGNGMENNAINAAIVMGPSGMVAAGQSASIGQRQQRARTSGTGECTPWMGAGGTCRADYECGDGYSCNGLGANTKTGGTIVGSSGTIVYGTGGSTTGRCGN